MGDGRDELDDPIILDAILQGALAGSCHYWSRQAPGCRALRTAARDHHAAATARIEEFLARRGANPAGPSTSEDGQNRPDGRSET